MVAAIHRRGNLPPQAPLRAPPKPRSPFGNGKSIWGGMPDYISGMQSEPLGAPMDEFSTTIAELNAQAGQPRPQQAQMPAQGAPQARPAFDMEAYAQKFEKPKMGWADKLGIIGGQLMDYDESWGTGHADRARGAYDQRVAEQQGEFEQDRQQQLLMAAAQGDETALAMLDPMANRSFKYNVAQDKKLDGRYEREWKREEGRYETEQERVDRIEKEEARRWGLNYALDERSTKAAEGSANAAKARKYEEDPNGVLRYLDDGQPVFPNVQPQSTQPVPGLPPPKMIPPNAPAGVVGALARSDEQAVAAARAAASQSRTRATLTQQFVDKADGYIAEGQGFFSDIGQVFSNTTSELKQITNKLGPNERPEGSGSTSDKDMQAYMEATVNINNTKGTNQDVAAMEGALAQADAAYAEWLQMYQAAYPDAGSLRDAKYHWDRYVNAPENQLFAVNKEGRVTVNQRAPIMDWLATNGAAAPAAEVGTGTVLSDAPTQTATNPQTGEKLGLVNGQWVPIQ
jgi:hypothetical protein